MTRTTVRSRPLAISRVPRNTDIIKALERAGIKGKTVTVQLTVAQRRKIDRVHRDVEEFLRKLDEWKKKSAKNDLTFG